MKRIVPLYGVLGLMALLGFATIASAAVNRITVYPSQVPDEEEPRGNLGDAPAGWGGSSWQGPATGKSNYHVRYLADGDALSALFPDDAASMTINDLGSISYYTKRPSGVASGRDWWVQIYTRDDNYWYGDRFINNYNDHSNTGDWVLYSTDDAMTFNHNGSKIGTNDTNGEMTLSNLKTNYGDKLVEMISIQTDSGWNGFDGYVDGLMITLTNGNVGEVDLSAVPEPATVAIWSLLAAAGIGLVSHRRRK